jgi:hypothetical protein
LDEIDNAAYQEGREIGRAVSTVQGAYEVAHGVTAVVIGLAAGPPTMAGGAACTAATAGACAVPTGIALTAEGTAVIGGAAEAVHGGLMLAKIGNDPLGHASKGNLWIPQKKVNQVTNRGWTLESIEDVVENPAMTRSDPTIINRATGNPVTYYYRADGYYVVIDDVTGQVVQVSDLFNPSWIDEMTNAPIAPVNP